MRSKFPTHVCRPALMCLGLLPLIEVEPAQAEERVISPFATQVLQHVLYHELGHALIREFDLPVLANEEAMADSFATLWVTQELRDKAPQIILSRVQSWLIEDSEVSPSAYDFKGEHPLDIRRAYQTACLFYGLDPAEFKTDVDFLDISQRDLADCSDTAPDQQEGWNQVLETALLADDARSAKVEVIYGEGPWADAMRASGVMEGFADQVARFDWPLKITLHFDHCDRGAFWNRSSRTIMLCDDYVARFEAQRSALFGAK